MYLVLLVLEDFGIGCFMGYVDDFKVVELELVDYVVY